MRKALVLSVFCTMIVPAMTAHARKPPRAAAKPDPRIEKLLSQMTLEEKIALLAGDETGFNSPGVPRLGVPPLRMADGPAGVRSGEATAFPAPATLAASFDRDLVRRYGVALAEQTRAKGKTIILGPCVGIHRFPLNGRNFESLGEDPFLSGRMAVELVRGIQSKNVVATVKHFAANDQEWRRNDYDVVVDERTLREIHLVPFEAAVKEGGAFALMTAYNLVNGQHCSENQRLVREVLKDEWGFPGIVMSDWVSVYSTEAAATNGLDLEMPHPVWFGEKLLAAVKSGKVAAKVIDDKVRRHLWVRFQSGLFESHSPAVDEAVVRSDAHRALALEIAQKGVVLLKNDGLLPIDPKGVKTVAMIGPAARIARTGGGGSALVSPWRSTSPMEGLATVLGSKVKIRYAEGARVDPFRPVPIPTEYLRTADGRRGMQGEYWDNPRFEGKSVFTRVDPLVDFHRDGGYQIDPRIPASNYSIRWTGKLVPPATRKYELAILSDDGSMLYVDGKLVADNWGQHPDVSVSAELQLVAGRSYDIRIDYYQAGGGATMRFGWRDPKAESGPTVAEAVQAARGADLAVVCVGNTHHSEGEGADVPDLEMVGRQGELVRAVLEANPNTVVVVFGGVPVRMKEWLPRARAVLAAFYVGQEGGDALAQIITGAVNPSGKLPFSYIQERSESPAFKDYKDPGLKIRYDEGVFVGYRYHDQNKVEPLFPFGHGLSYTKFDYANLRVERKGRASFVVKLDVTNRGAVKGAEAVQLYVAPPRGKVPRPPKELKGFAKLELAPGETGTATMALDERAFQYFDPTARSWKLVPGEYELQVGASSRDLRLHEKLKLR